MNVAKLSPLLISALLLTACGDNQTRFGGGSQSTTPVGSGNGEPLLETDAATLDASLKCLPFTHPDKPPVLLVHGTMTNGFEQYDWTYIPLLDERGFDVCAVTYPDRGLGDQQISAEYVVHALRKIHTETGRKVAMIGHSQGAGMPRWSLKWWPSARNAVEDFVLQAGPNHGTTVADPGGMANSNPLGMPAAIYQFNPSSNFIAAVNQGDETPGDISYTSLYTATDELVQPFGAPFGDPTAALDLGQDNPKVTNLLMQDLCPASLVDHLTIGTTDPVAFALTLDAISNPGPANIERAGGAALCTSILPTPVSPSTDALVLVDILMQEQLAPPEFHAVTEEPPLKAYAQ